MKRRFLDLLVDKNGVAAIAFAVSATVFIGMAGFGVETGTWYLEKRHGQNVADASALGGVMALLQTPAGDPVAAGTALGTANGYLTSEVSITQGTYTGGAGCTGTAPCSAVTARITRATQPLLTSLIYGTSFNIIETAKAALATVSSGCALSLSGGMTVQGNTTLNNCSLMSDQNTTINGAAHSTTGGSIISAGTCTSNGGNNACGPVDQPKVADPFLSVQSAALPTASTTNCQNVPGAGVALVPFETNGKIYCNGTFGTGPSRVNYTDNWSLTTSMNIAPGTYVFYGGPNGSNATVSIGNGGNLTCTACTIGGAGVTFIFTGDSSNNYASLSITGTVKLNAPATPTTCAAGLVAPPQCVAVTPPATTSLDGGAFKGVLFYMDKNAPATNGNGNAPVVITANGQTTLTGGMYFPSVNVTYGGNAVSTTNGCTEVVGKSLTFSGNTTLDVSHCDVSGTSVPKVKTAVLVQ